MCRISIVSISKFVSLEISLKKAMGGNCMRCAIND